MFFDTAMCTGDLELSQKRNLNSISAFSGIEFVIHLNIPYDCPYANMKYIWQKFLLKVPSKFMSHKKLFINLYLAIVYSVRSDRYKLTDNKKT